MKRRTAITKEREVLVDIQSMVEVYQEVAAERMAGVRQSILSGREFFEGLLDVYRDAKPSWRHAKKDPLKKRSGSVALFLSANAGLYGSIVEHVAEEFIRFVRKSHCAAVVVGKMGMNLLSERAPDVVYTSIDFSDDEINLDNLSTLMKHILRYEKLYIFHGKYESLVEQHPIVSTVSGDSADEAAGREKKMRLQYLFEPTPEAIAQVFEDEVSASLVEQAISESHLAKFAARMMYLDQSLERIGRRKLMIAQAERKADHAGANRSQQGVLASISLWSQ